MKLTSPPLEVIEKWCRENGIDVIHAKEIQENLRNARKHPAFLRQLKLDKRPKM